MISASSAQVMRSLFEVVFKIVIMNLNNIRSYLETSWQEYLKNRGHFIYRTRTCLPVIKSRNDRKTRYRWLLLVGQNRKRPLSKSELSKIHYNLKQAKREKEAAYLVVGFLQEPRRIIVLPANSVLEARCVNSDKGGIAWDY